MERIHSRDTGRRDTVEVDPPYIAPPLSLRGHPREEQKVAI